MLVAFSSLFGLHLSASFIACFAWFRSRNTWVYLGAAVVTVAALVCGSVVAVAAWWRGLAMGLDLSALFPFRFLLSLDRLSGFFLFVVCAVSIPAVIYSVRYVEQHYAKARATWYWILLPLFLLSMAVVVASASVFAF